MLVALGGFYWKFDLSSGWHQVVSKVLMNLAVYLFMLNLEQDTPETLTFIVPQQWHSGLSFELSCVPVSIGYTDLFRDVVIKLWTNFFGNSTVG